MKKKELNYIKHYRDVFEVLNQTDFEKICLDYEEHMYYFLSNQKFNFSSKSIEKNIESVFGKTSKIFIIYKAKCSLLEKDITIKKLQSSLLGYTNTNRKIMSSNSWKLTNPLEKLELY